MMQSYRRTLLMLLFGVLFLGVTARAQFKPIDNKQNKAPVHRGDYWLKTERKGTAFAYRRMLTRQNEGGTWTYYATDRRKIDIAGHDPQEIVTKGTYVVDSLFNVVSFEFIERSRSRDLDMKGTCAKGMMTVTVSDKGGIKREIEVPCANVTFEPAIPDIVLERAGSEAMTIGVFDPETFSVTVYEIEITNAGDSLVVARVTDGLLSAEYAVDRRLGLMEISLEALGMVSRRTSSADARTIVDLRTDDGMTLTVEADKPFPNVYTVEKARIRVGWKNIPFEMFRFTDNRQRIVEVDTVGASRHVVLEMTAVREPADGVKIPVTDESFRPYLGSGEFILPDDSQVVSLAGAISQGSSDGLQVVKRILEWISANISTKYTAVTLSAPEVLQDKSGKCSEYAILFASLARAAGVPAKVVLGEVYSSGKWVGHMYNEVWLGQWVAVDPTAGTFVSGPSHIKLSESATVKGTQQVRMGLIDNLSIEIIDFNEKDS